MTKTLRFYGWFVALLVVSLMFQPMPFAQAQYEDGKKIPSVTPAPEVEGFADQDSIDDKENTDPDDEDEDDD